MNTIFISYSYNDITARNIVSKISKILNDFQIKIYSNDEFSNQDVRHNLTDKIDKCNLFICIFDSHNSNIMFELGYALGKNKKLMLIGDYNEIPYELKDFKFIAKSDNTNEILAEINGNLSLDTGYDKNVICYSEYLESIKRALIDQDFLDNMSYQDFEKVIYEYLKAQEIDVELPAMVRDCGYDFKISDLSCIVEVKKYKKNSKISLSAIRTLLGAMIEEQVDKGILISSSEYTMSALSFIQSLNQKIVLLTLQDLLTLNGKFKTVFDRKCNKD